MDKQHSFGGRYFDRFIDFEPDDGLGGGAVLEGSEVAAAPAPAAVVEPPPAAAVVPAPEEEIPPPPLTREDVLEAAREAALAGSGEAFRTMVAQMEAEERARAAAVPRELPTWDPYDPQVVLAHVVSSLTPLFQRIETAANAGLTVAQEREQEQGKQEAHALLDKMMEGDEAITFDKERAIAGARVMLMVEPGLAPEDALKRAAQAEVEYAGQIEARTMEKLGLVAENHRAVAPEPGSGAAAAAEVSTLPRGKDAYRVQLERSLAARGLRPGVVAPA